MTHVHLSEPLTSVCGTQFEKHWSTYRFYQKDERAKPGHLPLKMLFRKSWTIELTFRGTLFEKQWSTYCLYHKETPAEHGTFPDNAVSKIVDHCTYVPRNTVSEALHIAFTRRTNGQSLGTFHRQRSFENRGSLHWSSAEHCFRSTIYCLYQKDERAESGNIPQTTLFRKSWITAQKFRGTLFQKHYILPLPEGRTGRIWEHSTDNALWKIVNHCIEVPRNTVSEALYIAFYQKDERAESGNIP